MSAGGIESDFCALGDLAAVICFAPRLDQPDPGISTEAREVLRAARRVKRNLDVVLTDDVRAAVVMLIEHLDQNRGRYRLAMLRWVDLLEDIAYDTEVRYGDGTGPLKQREVRAALYYVLKGFLGGEGLPTLPPWSRPIMLEIFLRATVEFLVTLDNPKTNRPMLWADAPPEGTYRSTTFTLSKANRLRSAKWREASSQRFTTFLVGVFWPEPKLGGQLKRDVDAILNAWAERNRLLGDKPFERATASLVQSALWIGKHGDQVRAAIDAIALTVHETARLTRLDREQQLQVVTEAIVMMFQDLGYTGPMFAAVVRYMVGMMADAIRHLFEKRNPRAA